MSDMPLETCWAFNERWINKFYYKVASCWLFLPSHTTMHGSMNIKFHHVCLSGSVRPSAWNNSSPTGRIFIEILVFVDNVPDKIQVTLKSDKNNGYFTWILLYIFYHISLISSCNEKCFRQKLLGKLETHILCSISCFYFRKSCSLWDNVDKCCRAGHVTDDNTMHSHFVLNTLGYKHTLKIWNTYSLSNASVVTRTRVSVTTYVHGVSCFHIVCQDIRIKIWPGYLEISWWSPLPLE
jgi:hypothetical protein